MTLLHRTPLNRDFSQSMIENAYSKFMEDMAATVQLKRFDATTVANDTYDEAIAKSYLADVPLLSKVRLKPSAKYLQESGIIEKVDAVFIFSQKQLTDLALTITHKDLLVFKGVTYFIKDVSPMGQIQDKNFFVMVQCVDTPEA